MLCKQCWCCLKSSQSRGLSFFHITREKNDQQGILREVTHGQLWRGACGFTCLFFMHFATFLCHVPSCLCTCECELLVCYSVGAHCHLFGKWANVSVSVELVCMHIHKSMNTTVTAQQLLKTKASNPFCVYKSCVCVCVLCCVCVAGLILELHVYKTTTWGHTANS